jgi:hypothetical protein
MLLHPLIWLSIVLASCAVAGTITGMVSLKRWSWWSALGVRFLGAWMVAVMLAYYAGAASFLIFALSEDRFVAYDVGKQLMHVLGAMHPYALTTAVITFLYGPISALAVATNVAVLDSSLQRRRKHRPYRDTLLISCIFTAILYFYPLLAMLWPAYQARQARQLGTKLPFLIQLMLANTDWLRHYWYFFIPTVFLPCFVVAAHWNARYRRIRQQLSTGAEAARPPE